GSFKAITSTSLTNLTRSNLLTIDFDNRKQAFGTRATIRDQTGSPEG
ncbi:15713_t:CDS:1, partial [Rhizophagus irregularis]